MYMHTCDVYIYTHTHTHTHIHTHTLLLQLVIGVLMQYFEEAQKVPVCFLPPPPHSYVRRESARARERERACTERGCGGGGAEETRESNLFIPAHLM
jgi:hypothetical protein